MGIPKKMIDHYSKPLTADQVNYLHKLHDVTIEKCDVYMDFSISLNYCINDTYLGDDTINSQDTKLTHFNWCWVKTINDFSDENLFFVEKGEHYYYFLNYFTDTFYNIEDNNKPDLDWVKNYWVNTFRFDGTKTKYEYNVFIQVYRLLDEYFLNND